MDELDFTNEELQVKTKAYRAEAKVLLRKANRCDAVISVRNSMVMQATANAAIKRAKEGVCTQGVGDCPVHQMGSCRVVIDAYGGARYRDGNRDGSMKF